MKALSEADARLLERFADGLWLEDGLARNTLESYRRDLAQFALWLGEAGGRDLLAALPEDLQRHLAWQVGTRHAKPRSTGRLVSTLRRFLFTEGSVDHAATGLAAAWRMTHFAAFRIATFFLAESPSKELREKLGFREDPRGANLWLVLPNDAGVFHGAETRDGLRCVHPVQAYVDLKAHPERATEAAERLRSELLSWRHDG